MSYLGSTPASQFFAPGTDTFSGTGSQTAFTLSRNVATVNDILVVVNNVDQQPSNYTVLNNVLTFSPAPSAGTNNIYVRYLSTNLQTIAPQAGSVTKQGLDVGNSDGTGATILPTGTTAQRPSIPLNGMYRMNSTTGYPEYYDGTTWYQVNQSKTITATYLVIAGGGGGASGGGGAGGALTGSVTLTPSAVYTITIGAGGTGGTGNTSGTAATNGANSVFSGSGITTQTAVGGGGGARTGNAGDTAGYAGGSGGGGGAFASSTTTGGAGTSGQGFAGGGNGGQLASPFPTGGGGGASAIGSNATSSTVSGNGGAGITSSITGSAVVYAGGGGGGVFTTPSTAGTGGTGGGGNGSNVANGSAGTVNTGSGGGGTYNLGTGGAGGSGVVFISIPTVSYTGTITGAPTVTTSGSNTILRYTASGTYTA
jgi:hypothetical protein